MRRARKPWPALLRAHERPGSLALAEAISTAPGRRRPPAARVARVACATLGGRAPFAGRRGRGAWDCRVGYGLTGTAASLARRHTPFSAGTRRHPHVTSRLPG